MSEAKGQPESAPPSNEAAPAAPAADEGPLPHPTVAYVTDNAYGRCVVAAEGSEIETGDLIVSGEEPMVHAIEDVDAALGCHWSFARLDEDEEAFWCDGKEGELPVYETATARDEAVASGADAADRVFYSKYLKDLASFTGAQDTGPLRMLLKILRLRDGTAEQQARYAQLQTLCSGEESIDETTKRSAAAVAMIAQSILPDETKFEVDDIIDMLFKCYCNTHSMRDFDSLQCNGMGLFDFGSRFNHSCDPNCSFYTRRGKLHVRALKDIEPGEELTITYCELYATRAQRNKKLYSKYSFTCTCLRCANEETVDRELCAYKCNAPGPDGNKCAGTIPYFDAIEPIRAEGKWGSCNVCGAAAPAKGDEIRQSVTEAVAKVEAACGLIDAGDLEQCGKVTKLVGVLARNLAGQNAVLMDVLLTASSVFLNAGCGLGEHSSAVVFMMHTVYFASHEVPLSCCGVGRGSSRSVCSTICKQHGPRIPSRSLWAHTAHHRACLDLTVWTQPTCATVNHCMGCYSLVAYPTLQAKHTRLPLLPSLHTSHVSCCSFSPPMLHSLHYLTCRVAPGAL